MKSARRFSKASGSTKRRVDKIIRLGEHATKRTLSASRRRELAERLDMRDDSISIDPHDLKMSNTSTAAQFVRRVPLAVRLALTSPAIIF